MEYTIKFDINYKHAAIFIEATTWIHNSTNGRPVKAGDVHHAEKGELDITTIENQDAIQNFKDMVIAKAKRKADIVATALVFVETNKIITSDTYTDRGYKP